MNVRYHAKRCVPAAVSPGMPPTTLIAMVQIELPDGGITPLAINEETITEHAHGDIVKEELFIQQKVRETVNSMLAGATGDMILTPS
jgi:hypothetical protein